MSVHQILVPVWNIQSYRGILYTTMIDAKQWETSDNYLEILPTHIRLTQYHIMHHIWPPRFVGINFQFMNHAVGNEQTKQWLVHNIYWDEFFIHHLASSLVEVAPLPPRKISASLSLLDSEWRNLRDSIVMESKLSSKGQFASSKLNINRDTWKIHKLAEIQGRRILAYNERIN